MLHLEVVTEMVKKKKIVQLIASEVHENETHYHPPRIYLLIWKKTIA